jgi:hypothetical protein
VLADYKSEANTEKQMSKTKAREPGLAPRSAPEVLQMPKFACYTAIFGAIVKELIVIVLK